MSIARQFFREFRPLFRLLEEPLTSNPVGRFPRNSPFAVLNDPFFEGRGAWLQQPAVDLAEEGNHYVIEAELPGVKKENVDIRVGDNGQSLTIEGKTFSRSTSSREDSSGIERKSVDDASNASVSESNAGAVTEPSASHSNQISTERTLSRTSSFTRTIWLPRRVDPTNVSAKLQDGVLTVRIPKAEDLESVKVNIE